MSARGGSSLGSDLGSEIGDLLLDALADDVQGERGDLCLVRLAQLVDGLPAREGDVCGCEGTLVCGLDGVLTCIGESEPNDCGGCGILPGVKGETCGGCEGKWVCQEWNLEMVSCNMNTITATFRQVFEA